MRPDIIAATNARLEAIRACQDDISCQMTRLQLERGGLQRQLNGLEQQASVIKTWLHTVTATLETLNAAKTQTARCESRLRELLEVQIDQPISSGMPGELLSYNENNEKRRTATNPMSRHDSLQTTLSKTNNSSPANSPGPAALSPQPNESSSPHPIPSRASGTLPETAAAATLKSRRPDQQFYVARSKSSGRQAVDEGAGGDDIAQSTDGPPNRNRITTRRKRVYPAEDMTG